jgi:Dolichyl-phosphate-mannose-protein mannosyltransferase
MKNFLRRDGDATFAAALVVALLAGIFLRTYLLAAQVLIDDEWHGFYYALGKSPLWLLTHFSIPGATCIPLNFYTWLLGVGGGWSEIWLRLPSLACGILCVFVCPLLAKKIIGARPSGWLALLLAISPLLIFYSRICRPYSAVALLGGAALLGAARWQQTGGFRPALFFGITGVLAVYFHLFAVVTVAAPVLVAIIFHLLARVMKQPPMSGPSLRQWLLVAAGMALAGAALVLPALVHSMQSTFFTIALKGTFRLESLPRVAMLISGTGSPVLAGLFWLLLVAGASEQCRRNLWFGVTLLSLYPLHALALMFSRPDGTQSAIVLARYCIPLVPVSLLLVACGLQTALTFLNRQVVLRPASQILLASAGIGALLFGGPLPRTYTAPNNFTSHGAYQHRYAPVDWSQSFYSDLTPADFTLVTTIRADEISPFYRRLAAEGISQPVIEYPMMIGDHFNPFYYYQHFHKRPVLVGYTTGVVLARGLAAGNIFGNTYIDQVLSLVEKPAQLKFQNLVCLDDLAAMRARHAEYVILHKQFEAQLPLVKPPPPDLERLSREYRIKIGAPVYEDANVIVFRL